jgi:hypothetical protein
MATVKRTRCSEAGCKRMRYDNGSQQFAVCFMHRSIERTRAALAIVQTGVCPTCGTGLVRNTALSGWWQCGAYAAESHRQPEYRGLPKCHFQTFTD